MGLIDYVIIALVAAILGFACWFIYKSKKSGKKCIGCPDSCACSAGNCGCGCSGCREKE